jgi:hypothetical protein
MRVFGGLERGLVIWIVDKNKAIERFVVDLLLGENGALALVYEVILFFARDAPDSKLELYAFPVYDAIPDLQVEATDMITQIRKPYLDPIDSQPLLIFETSSFNASSRNPVLSTFSAPIIITSMMLCSFSFALGGVFASFIE